VCAAATRALLLLSLLAPRVICEALTRAPSSTSYLVPRGVCAAATRAHSSTPSPCATGKLVCLCMRPLCVSAPCACAQGSDQSRGREHAARTRVSARRRIDATHAARPSARAGGSDLLRCVSALVLAPRR